MRRRRRTEPGHCGMLFRFQPHRRRNSALPNSLRRAPSGDTSGSRSAPPAASASRGDDDDDDDDDDNDGDDDDDENDDDNDDDDDDDDDGTFVHRLPAACRLPAVCP